MKKIYKLLSMFAFACSSVAAIGCQGFAVNMLAPLFPPPSTAPSTTQLNIGWGFIVFNNTTAREQNPDDPQESGGGNGAYVELDGAAGDVWIVRDPSTDKQIGVLIEQPQPGGEYPVYPPNDGNQELGKPIGKIIMSASQAVAQAPVKNDSAMVAAYESKSATNSKQVMRSNAASSAKGSECVVDQALARQLVQRPELLAALLGSLTRPLKEHHLKSDLSPREASGILSKFLESGTACITSGEIRDTFLHYVSQE